MVKTCWFNEFIAGSAPALFDVQFISHEQNSKQQRNEDG